MPTLAELVMVRCPTCKGLRAAPERYVTANNHQCKECRRGNVVERNQFHNYWTERFTMEEIRDMGRAIWG